MTRTGNQRAHRRAVVHIETHGEIGKRGTFWGLWLSCGHYATRSIPSFRIFRVPPVAPREVHCLLCEDGMPTVPLPHDLFRRRALAEDA